MIETREILVVNYSQVINRFCELTNWSSAHQGAWNADFSKPIVFSVELHEYTCQHEQDWMCFYYPDNCEEVNIDRNSLIDEENCGEYNGQRVYSIHLESILKWLILMNELPTESEFLVKQ